MRHTVKNGTSEEHQELDEQVLLLGGDLVPAEALSPLLHGVVVDTLLDVGVEPLVRDDASIFVSGLLRVAGPPELEPCC